MQKIKDFIKDIYNSISLRNKIFTIIGLLIVLFSIPKLISIYKENKIKDTLYTKYLNGTLYPEDNHVSDSLQTIINYQTKIIASNDIKLDSLYKLKSAKTITYETTIKNYSTPSIISDDSITSYISKKLHNQ